MSWFKKAKQNKLSYDFKNQEMGLDENFGDIQRYVFDSYNLRIFLNKTNYKITISLVATHSYLGTVILSLFWSFDKDEESKARSAYREVIKICKETMSEFVKKEIPTNLFFPFIRKRLPDIRSRTLIRPTIPILITPMIFVLKMIGEGPYMDHVILNIKKRVSHSI